MYESVKLATASVPIASPRVISPENRTDSRPHARRLQTCSAPAKAGLPEAIDDGGARHFEVIFLRLSHAAGAAFRAALDDGIYVWNRAEDGGCEEQG